MAQNSLTSSATTLVQQPPSGIEASPLESKSSVSLKSSWETQCLKLNAEERETFASHACNNLQDYVRTIEDACQRSKDRSSGYKILEWFEPIFKVVELYLPALNIGIQAYPNPGSLVLGGITAIVQTFSRLTSYLKLTMKTLSTMGKKISILLRYDKDIYSDELELQKSLVAVYGDVLGFCRRAFRFKKKHGDTLARIKGVGLVLFTNFESHFDQELRSFYSNMEQVESLALLCDKKRLEELCRGQEAHRKDFAQVAQETRDYFQNQSYRDQLLIDLAKREHELREQEARSKKEDFKARSLAWLSSLDFDQAYAQRCREHLPGTGQWLLDSNIYNEWKTGEDSDLIWIKGKPGCGKSVLAACAIHNLRLEANSETACGYAFCRRDSESFEHPSSILGALARQISEQKEDIDPILELSFNMSHRGLPPSLKTISSIMRAAVSRFSRTYLVLDALDECKDNHEIASEIVDLMHEHAGSPVKIMILSRPDFVLEQTFDSCKLVQPDIGDNEVDVQAYVESLFADKSQAITSRKIIDECISKADGTFLWVRLLKEEFRMTPMTLRQQLECLQETPAGLSETYSRMIESLCNQKPSVRVTASRVLLWVIHARRPLTENEMLNAVADYTGVQTVRQASDSRYAKAEHLVIICKHLVSIDRDRCFRLCHESAREIVLDYLWKAGYEDIQHGVQDDASSQHVSGYLAETCLTYLLLKTFERGPARSIARLRILNKKYPLLEYASRFWAAHLPLETSSHLRSLILEFVHSPPRRELSMQIVLHSSEGVEDFWNFPGSSNALHILSLLGLRTTADALPDAASFTREADGLGFTPLIYALIGKHHDMSRWLIERMRTPEGLSLDSEQKKATLHQAVVLGWLDVLQTLVAIEDPVINSVVDKGGSLLAKACYMADVEAAKFLIHCKADVDLKDGYGNSPLVLSVLNEQTSIVKLLLENSADIESTDAEGCTPLHIAAKIGNDDVVEALLFSGANPQARALLQDDMTPLHFAAAEQSLGAIKALHRAYPKLDMVTTKKHTPLHTAASFRRPKSAELLLQLGCPKDETDYEHQTALLIATEKGSLDTVKVLSEAGCKTGQADIHGRNEIHAAARSGKASVADYLLTREPTERRLALVNMSSNIREAPLHEAAHAGSVRMLKFLLNNGANVEAHGVFGLSALHYAAYQGHKAMLRPLLKRTGNANPRNDTGDTPLHLAARYGKIEFIRYFFQECSNGGYSIHLDAQNVTNETALTTALFEGFQEVAEFLLERGSTSVRNSNKNYPIHLAAWQGFQSIVKKLLVENGVSSQGYGGRTPLYCAASRGHIECVKLLASHTDARLNTPDNSGRTPVLAALEGSHFETVDYLLDQKADHEIQDQDGNDMIHIASALGSLSTVRRLLDLGCNGSRSNNDGSTACHFAVQANHIEIVDALVAQGNTITRPGFLGCSCAHIAAQQGNLAMLERLVEHGADCSCLDHLGSSIASYAASCGQWEILNFLKDREVQFDLANFEGATPLIVAAGAGSPRTVKWLLDADSRGINKFNSAGESALILATGLGCPKTIQVLLAYGADPYHRDSNGMNALEYAKRHRILLSEFVKMRHSTGIHAEEVRQDEDTGRRRRHATIRECCKTLVSLSEDSSATADLSKREMSITALANALLREQDYDNAKLCLMDLFWQQKPDILYRNYRCDICGLKNFGNDVYVCKSCPTSTARGRLDLCGSCHKSYKEAGFRAPKALVELELLEHKVQAVRALLPDALSLLSVVDIIDYFGAGRDWVQGMVKAYDDWEQTFNSTGTYKRLIRPGQQYLDMIQRVSVVMHKVNHGDEFVPEDIAQLKRAAKEYAILNRRHRADDELPFFLCAKHDFCVVAFDERRKLKDAGVDLDSESGKVTDSLLERLLATYASEPHIPTGLDEERREPRHSPDLPTDRIMGEVSTSGADQNHSRAVQTSTLHVGREDAPRVRFGTPLEQYNLRKAQNLQPSPRTQPLPIKAPGRNEVQMHHVRVDIKNTEFVAAIQARLGSSAEDEGPALGMPEGHRPFMTSKIGFAMVVESDAISDTASTSLNDGDKFSATHSNQIFQHSASTTSRSEPQLTSGSPMQGGSDAVADTHRRSLAKQNMKGIVSGDRKVANQTGLEARQTVAYIQHDESDNKDMNTWFQALTVVETMHPGFVESFLETKRLEQENRDASNESASESESESDEADNQRRHDTNDEEENSNSDEDDLEE